MTKAFIINFNRLLLPMKLADRLYDCGLEPIFIDNNSTYAPLLEYYKTCDYQVVHSKINYGHTVIWDLGLLDKLHVANDEKFIITDSDLDISDIPSDFLMVLEAGLEKYPQFDKCGFSLRINDLPKTNLSEYIIAAERGYWENPMDEMYFNANTDTTLCLYKTRYKSFSTIRTNEPYCAKHVPWYYENYDDLSDDEKYYFDTTAKRTFFSSEINKRVFKKNENK